MNRRHFIAVLGATPFAPHAIAAASARPSFKIKSFELDEASIADLQAAMKSGRATAVSLAKKYLERIGDIDKRGPVINSVIETNPEVMAIARELDRERKSKGPRGPLHGIPLL